MHPLNAWRKHRGLTIEQAAETIGVKFGTFTDWIYMRRFPRAPNLTKIESATDGAVTAAALYDAWRAQHQPEAAQ